MFYLWNNSRFLWLIGVAKEVLLMALKINVEVILAKRSTLKHFVPTMEMMLTWKKLLIPYWLLIKGLLWNIFFINSRPQCWVIVYNNLKRAGLLRFQPDESGLVIWFEARILTWQPGFNTCLYNPQKIRPKKITKKSFPLKTCKATIKYWKKEVSLGKAWVLFKIIFQFVHEIGTHIAPFFILIMFPWVYGVLALGRGERENL